MTSAQSKSNMSHHDAVLREREMFFDIARTSESIDNCPEHGEPTLCCRSQTIKWVRAYKALLDAAEASSEPKKAGA